MRHIYTTCGSVWTILCSCPFISCSGTVGNAYSWTLFMLCQSRLSGNYRTIPGISEDYSSDGAAEGGWEVLHGALKRLTCHEHACHLQFEIRFIPVRLVPRAVVRSSPRQNRTRTVVIAPAHIERLLFTPSDIVDVYTMLQSGMLCMM